MNTPIYDFVNEYISKAPVRLHMPGHKGAALLGIEPRDITELFGADELYSPHGIIYESEQNAARIFGANTFYSAGGSTLCIQAMVHLLCAYAKSRSKKGRILAARNAHKAFVNACALCDAEVDFFAGGGASYCECKISAEHLEQALKNGDYCAVYVTSPDYLGNVANIAEISAVCRRHGVLLATDCAHGAYLKFLPQSQYPTDLGADICCASAHKTLPVLTGGAYLHISHSAPSFFKENARRAMAIFGSSSPSYLILQSLDLFNAHSSKFIEELASATTRTDALRAELEGLGIKCIGNEPMKLTLCPKTIGTDGISFARHLINGNIYPEYYDPDFTVLMPSCRNTAEDLKRLFSVILSVPKKAPVESAPPRVHIPRRGMDMRGATLCESESLSIEKCVGKICAADGVCCPPAVCIALPGEIIDRETVDAFNYYGIKECRVVKDKKHN